jgi:O-antigen ligase
MKTQSRVLEFICAWSLLAFSRPVFLTPNLLALGTVLLLLVAALHLRITPRAPMLFGVFGLFATSSAFWADVPTATLNGAIAFFLYVFSASVLVRGQFTVGQFIATGDRLLRAISATCFVMGFVLPHVAIQSNGPTAGSLIGFYPERNNLGFMAAIGICFTVANWPGRRRLLAGSALSAHAAVLTWTGSQSSLVAVLVFCSLFWMLKRASRSGGSVRGFVAFLFLPVVAFTVVAVKRNLEAAVSLVGRDTSFSNRDQIWLDTLSLVGESPIYGLGYRSAFTETSASGDVFYRSLGWVPTGAHNGVLTTYLELGLIGVLLFVVVTAVLVTRLWRTFLRGSLPELSSFGLALTLTLIVVDTVEHKMFIGVGLFLMSYLYMLTSAELESDFAGRTKSPGPREGRTAGLGANSSLS